MSKRFEFIKAEQRSPAWFALRNDGITATDVAVIAGLSEYKTRFQLWAEKTGAVTEEPAGEAAQRGILLEDAVAQWYTLETGHKLKRSNGVVRLVEAPWAMASLDRTVVGEPGLVEIKTSTSRMWALEPVPAAVIAQVQWQAFITGAPWVDVAVLLGGLKFRRERVIADPVYQAELFAKAVQFRNLIATGWAPELIGEDSDTLAKVVPQSTEEWAQATGSIERVAALYAEKKYESVLLDQELSNLAISLKEAIGKGVGIAGAGWEATWKQNKPSVKTDWRAVAEAAKVPQEIVDAYTQETPGARVFKFKDGGAE
jgi:putative phage-type endonuclease